MFEFVTSNPYIHHIHHYHHLSYLSRSPVQLKPQTPSRFSIHLPLSILDLLLFFLRKLCWPCRALRIEPSLVEFVPESGLLAPAAVRGRRRSPSTVLRSPNAAATLSTKRRSPSQDPRSPSESLARRATLDARPSSRRQGFHLVSRSPSALPCSPSASSAGFFACLVSLGCFRDRLGVCFL